MLLNFLNNEEGSNISKNSEIERHAVMASILHPPKTMTPKHLRYALRMALAGLFFQSRGNTTPPLFGSPLGVFSPVQVPFQSSPSYEFTK